LVKLAYLSTCRAAVRACLRGPSCLPAACCLFQLLTSRRAGYAISWWICLSAVRVCVRVRVCITGPTLNVQRILMKFYWTDSLWDKAGLIRFPGAIRVTFQNPDPLQVIIGSPDPVIRCALSSSLLVIVYFERIKWWWWGEGGGGRGGGWMDGWIDWLIDWWIDGWIDWLIDWLIDWWMNTGQRSGRWKLENGLHWPGNICTTQNAAAVLGYWWWRQRWICMPRDVTEPLRLERAQRRAHVQCWRRFDAWQTEHSFWSALITPCFSTSSVYNTHLRRDGYFFIGAS